MSPNPIFQWGTVAGASSYELIVSTYAGFDNPTILKVNEYALSGTAWQGSPTLNYDTTYYWKVRAVSADTSSNWSAVGAFITESKPEQPIVSPAPQTPANQPTSGTTTALPQLFASDYLSLYLVGALLVTIILLIITLLIVIIRLGRA